MNAKAVARHYGSLTPEERFRLILAAGGRGDEAERDRLANAAKRITFSAQDFRPYANAFDELALLVFIELLEEAARYLDALHWADEDPDIFGDDEDEEAEGEPGPKADTGPAREGAGERPAWRRSLDLALAWGCLLRTKADGWKLFCERLSVPPFLLWDKLPGSDRLRRALALTDKAAFTPEGLVRWLNRARPAGGPERTGIAMTAEGFADAAAELFRERVGWWGG
jgi:hypothetical protein